MSINVRLPKDLEERLSRLAALLGCPETSCLQEALRLGLEELEDYYLAALVLDRIKKGEEKTYSLDEVERELGLES